MSKATAVILAAGEGRRMKSTRPKVLHEVCGHSMLEHVVYAARNVCSEIIVVIGHRGGEIREAIGGSVQYVKQEEQLGTAHAVMQAEALLPKDGIVLVLCGDTPLLSSDILSQLLVTYTQTGAAVTILTARVPEPLGYGRIIRDDAGFVRRIIEEKDATDKERMINEINTGTYIFDAESLRNALKHVDNSNAQGEYYLTDCVAQIHKQKKRVTTCLLDDYRMALGVNDRLQLAEAQSLMQAKINRQLMEQGVTIVDPATAYIDAGIMVGSDTIIRPNTCLKGNTQIGTGCTIGPNTDITDCKIGSNAVVGHSVVCGGVIEDGETVGPFAHLCPEIAPKKV